MQLAQRYKGLLTFAVVVAVVVFAYLHRNKIAAALGMRSASIVPTPNDGKATSVNTAAPQYTDNTVLKKGMRGDKVRELQVLLNMALKAQQKAGKLKGHELLIEDGIFGSKTLELLLALTLKGEISLNDFKQLS